MEDEDIIYDNAVSIDNLLLIFTSDTESVIGNVVDIDNEKLTITLSDDSEFSINGDGFLLLKTDKYEIVDIEKVEEFDVNEIDKVSKDLLTRDIYPELFIETEEVKDKVYSITEKRENLTSILIKSLNIYDDKYLLEVYSKFADELLKLVENKLDKRDHFRQILDFSKNQVLPDWIIPVSSNKIRSCPADERDIFGEYDSAIQEKSTKDLPFTSVVNNLYNPKEDNINDKFIEHGYEIQKYTKDFLRTCIREFTCTGIGFDRKFNYNIDIRRTRHPYELYRIQDDTYVKKLFEPSKELNICGFIFLSIDDNIYSTYKNLRINEILYKMNNDYTVYSNRIKLNTIIEKNNIIDIDVDINNILKYEYDSTTSYYFKTDTTYTTSEFQNVLYEYLPDPNIIVKTYDKEIMKYLFNYNDVVKLFHRYSIHIDNILLDTKLYLNDFILTNIENYIKLYHKLHGIVKFKSYNVIQKKMSIVDRIQLLKKYIYRETAERKLEYLQKFINKFAETKPNDTNLYNKFNQQILLCTHHEKLIDATNDESEYDYINYIKEFGEMHDDIYYCKYCHEYLSPDIDQSNVEFDEDNRPIYNEKIEIEEKEVKIEDIDVYKIAGLIGIICRVFGTELTNADFIEIIELYNSLDHKLFMISRYNNDRNIIKNNAFLNILDKQSRELYIVNTSKVIFITIVLSLYIQTSIPPYKTTLDSNIELVDLTNNDYKTININTGIIKNKLITSFITYHSQKLKLYNMEEFVKDIDPATPRFQFINCVVYIVSSKFNTILERIERYQEYKGITDNKYIKNEWTLYRPLSSNSTILKINRLLNTDNVKEHLLKKVGIYSLENVALFESLKDSKNKIKSEQLDISNIELLRNQSFLRLYDLILTLHGTLRDNIYMNLLIERLIKTGGKIENFIKNIFGEYGWDKKFKDGISFKNLRIILIQIIKYCRTDKECVRTLSLFVHKSFNNTRLITLNTRPKRIYSYIIGNVYPTEDYTDLHKDSAIRKIFDIYCYDINGVVIRRNAPIYKLIDSHINVDISIDMCEQKIIPNNDNFRLLIETLHVQNILPFIPYIDYINTPEERLIKYITANIRLTEPFDKIYNLFTDYQREKNILTDEMIKKYKLDNEELKSTLIDDRNTMIQEISDYLMKTDRITPEHKKLIDINYIYRLLKFTLNGGVSHFYYKYIKDIVRTIARIKNQKNKNRGCLFINHIPAKIVNISPYNHEKLETFLKSREFLLHDYVFINKNIDIKGFYEYLDDNITDKMIESYQNLFEIIQPYVIHLDLLQGMNETLFDKQFELNLIKYILILLLYKILDFVEDTDENEKDESGNELFNSLEKKSIEDLKERNETISSLLLDLVINIIQEHKDSEWVSVLSNKNDLAKKISKEREIEKQSLLNKKKNKSSIDRYIEDQMNAIGDSNMWREAKRDNEMRVETDEFDMDIIQQRKEADALRGINSDDLGKSSEDDEGYDMPGENDDDHED